MPTTKKKRAVALANLKQASSPDCKWSAPFWGTTIICVAPESAADSLQEKIGAFCERKSSQDKNGRTMVTLTYNAYNDIFLCKLLNYASNEIGRQVQEEAAKQQLAKEEQERVRQQGQQEDKERRMQENKSIANTLSIKTGVPWMYNDAKIYTNPSTKQLDFARLKLTAPVEYQEALQNEWGEYRYSYSFQGTALENLKNQLNPKDQEKSAKISFGSFCAALTSITKKLSHIIESLSAHKSENTMKKD